VGTSIFKIELKIMYGKKKTSNDLSLLFKEKEKEGEGRTKAWWPMEGEGEGFFSTSSHFPPNQLYLDLRFFPLKLKFYFTMVLGRYLRIPSLFLSL
jgi:hypothetical protein